MDHVGLAMKLKPGCADEYKRRHDELWPEITEQMSALGIDMIIYQFGDTLFVHGAGTTEAWATMAAASVTPRWNAYMADVLETDDDGAIIKHDLAAVFSFGKYAQPKAER